jgi:hypothetical protein
VASFSKHSALDGIESFEMQVVHDRLAAACDGMSPCHDTAQATDVDCRTKRSAYMDVVATESIMCTIALQKKS